MAERPIIFSAPMVRAILDRRKTQTRRVMKHGWAPEHRIVSLPDGPNKGLRVIPCEAGDLLWVREACLAEELSRPQFERPATAAERKRLKRTTVIECPEDDGADGVRYLADNEWRKIENTPEAGEAWSALYHYRGRGKGRTGNTVPPIHMPRWASRITLRVTDVRVQRLLEISEEDAKAEGVSLPAILHDDDGSSYVDQFGDLWNYIHGPSSWDANPWVAAISFERINPTP